MRWYFDYISPYAYLQSTRLAELNHLQDVECVPTLFAGLLNHWGNLGPAEIDSKRIWTFRDVSWLAHRDNIELTLPGQHPFNPLPLLRLGIVHNNEISVVQKIFRYVWVDGNTPQDETAFSGLLKELNTAPAELNSDSVKTQLLENGKQAIENGVFGVPTIELDQELYWGYDATEMVISCLTDPDNFPFDKMHTADSLPQGTARRNSPNSSKKPSSQTSAHSNVDNSSGTRKKEPRIPLKPIDIAEPADLVAAIRARRGGELIELDRLLLYSAPLAEGWNHYLGNIREHFSIDRKLRELAMCTVAVLNNAEYEFSQHAPLYISAGGSVEKVQLLRKPSDAAIHRSFSTEEQLTIALTAQMTSKVQVDEKLFRQAMDCFSIEHLVELVATIAAYNMVSRFLVAFELHP